MHKYKSLTPDEIAYLLFSIAITASLSAFSVNGIAVPQILFQISVLATTVLGFIIIYKLTGPFFDKSKIYQALPNSMVLFIFGIVLVRLATSGFDEDDEIYSWNMWAIQHFNGEEADFKYTQSPYPQLFSYWLAGIYRAFGGYVFQSVPRAYLALTTLIIGSALTLPACAKSWKEAAFNTLIIFITLASVIPWMCRGLADPLMSAAMIASGLFIYKYYKDPDKLHMLLYALAAAVIAATTKQAGIFWACVSMPAIVATGIIKSNWHKKTILYSLTALAASLIWPLIIAPTFIKNQGVISASTEGRGIGEQLLFSINEYILIRPQFILLYILLIWFARKVSFVRIVTLVAVIPLLLLWFQFGAYSLRLGIHVVGIATLLTIIGYSEETIKKCKSIEIQENCKNTSTKIISLQILSACFYALVLIFSTLKIASILGTDLKDGAKTAIKTQWGEEAIPIFEDIFLSKRPIWIISNYAYGALYGRANLIEPVNAASENNIENLKKDLMESGARYVVYSEVVPKQPYSNLIIQLISECPAAFKVLLGPDNQKRFMLYELNSEKLTNEICSSHS
jgi:hypothetical protein